MVVENVKDQAIFICDAHFKMYIKCARFAKIMFIACKILLLNFKKCYISGMWYI